MKLIIYLLFICCYRFQSNPLALASNNLKNSCFLDLLTIYISPYLIPLLLLKSPLMALKAFVDDIYAIVDLILFCGRVSDL